MHRKHVGVMLQAFHAGTCNPALGTTSPAARAAQPASQEQASELEFPLAAGDTWRPVTSGEQACAARRAAGFAAAKARSRLAWKGE